MSLNRNTEITYLGHATILIESPGGKRILIDPWTHGNPSFPEEWKQDDRLNNLDIILVTHLHSDHIGDFETVMKTSPKADVVAIFDSGPALTARGMQNFKGMNKGGTQELQGIRITMTHAVHSNSIQEADGALTYGGEPVGYILQMENGFTLYAAGDTALFGDMNLIRLFYRPELGLLPIGDHFTMGPAEAAAAAEMLGITHLIPIHHSTFPLLTGTPEKLASMLSHQPGIHVHPLKPGEALS